MLVNSVILNSYKSIVLSNSKQVTSQENNHDCDSWFSAHPRNSRRKFVEVGGNTETRKVVFKIIIYLFQRDTTACFIKRKNFESPAIRFQAILTSRQNHF
jgi:hypothetical protein